MSFTNERRKPEASAPRKPKANIMTADKTHGTFGDILAIATPQIRLVCESMRQQIASLHEDFVEIVWPRQRIASFGIGPRKMTQHYAYVAVHDSHANLGSYHGASLSDPNGLLEGTGKKLRHVKISDVASARDPAVIALLRAAVADRKRHASAT